LTEHFTPACVKAFVFLPTTIFRPDNVTAHSKEQAIICVKELLEHHKFGHPVTQAPLVFVDEAVQRLSVVLASLAEKLHRLLTVKGGGAIHSLLDACPIIQYVFDCPLLHSGLAVCACGTCFTICSCEYSSPPTCFNFFVLFGYWRGMLTHCSLSCTNMTEFMAE
jgi:hypothetical protein